MISTMLKKSYQKNAESLSKKSGLGVKPAIRQAGLLTACIIQFLDL